MEPSAEPTGASSIVDERTVSQQISVGLMKVGLAIRSQAWAGGESTGLTPTQGQILALIHQRREAETRTSHVATELAIAQPTATVAIRTLVEKGLVRKTRSATDSRAQALTLTDEGREQAIRGQSWTDFLLEAASELDQHEQDIFLRSIVKMIRSMQEKGQIPVARMCANCEFFRPNAHPGEPHPHHCAFVDAPFSDRNLRLECTDFEPAPQAIATRNWETFATHAE